MNKYLLSFALAAGFIAATANVVADGGHTNSYLDGYLDDTGSGYIKSFPGNFVAEDDDQVCYNLYGDRSLGELHGFKVDPPVSGTFNGIEVTLIEKGKYLAWSAADSIAVLAVVVKGGPSYNLYDYLNASLDLGIPIPNSDAYLHSPLYKGKIPAISHFNFCYKKDLVVGDEGCTPGYWRNHADRWAGVEPKDGFDATFGVTSGLGAEYTLGQAIWAQGGGILALARHGTAALLNAYGGVPNQDGTTVEYQYSAAEVLARVQAAIDSGDPALIESTKDLLADANEAGCPLSGTPASPAPN